MKTNAVRRIGAASVVILAVSGSGAALAATSHGGKSSVVHAARAQLAHLDGSGSPGAPGDDLAAAASYLGLTSSALQTDLQSGKTLAQVAGATSGTTVDGLVQALVAAEKTEWDAQVTAGTLTQAQETAMLPTLTQRFTDFVNGTGAGGGGGFPAGPGGGGPGGPGGPGGSSDDLAAAASYLGLTSSALQTDVQSGKTLAQVAGATSGKSVDGLVQALVAAEKTEWDAQVTAGTLTQAQETAMLPTLTQRFTDFVNGTGAGRGGGFPAGPGGGGPGGPGGPGGSSDDLAAAASYLGLTSSVLQTDVQSGKTLAQVAGATSGKSVDGLVQALVAAEKTEWDAQVTAGTLTQAQETAMLPTLTQRFTDFVNGTGGR